MRSTSLFPCIMTTISNLNIFLIFQIFTFCFFLRKYDKFSHFQMVLAAILFITSFSLFKINYLHCVLSQKPRPYNFYLYIIMVVFYAPIYQNIRHFFILSSLEVLSWSFLSCRIESSFSRNIRKLCFPKNMKSFFLRKYKKSFSECFF